MSGPVFDEDDDVRRYRQRAEDALFLSFTSDAANNASLIEAYRADMARYREMREREWRTGEDWRLRGSPGNDPALPAGWEDTYARRAEDETMLLATDRQPLRPTDLHVVVDPSRIQVRS
jgi:hypothetical protein